MFGRRSALYRRAMRNIWRVQANPTLLLAYKDDPAQTYALDVRLLATLTRYYWFLPAFWRHSFPVLLRPHRTGSLRARADFICGRGHEFFEAVRSNLGGRG